MKYTKNCFPQNNGYFEQVSICYILLVWHLQTLTKAIIRISADAGSGGGGGGGGGNEDDYGKYNGIASISSLSSYSLSQSK